MALGLIGIKQGMTSIYTEDGRAISVTVVEVVPNSITQTKTEDKEGYTAVQLAVGLPRRASLISSALAGHYAKAKVEPRQRLCEFRLNNASEVEQFKSGQSIGVKYFQVGQYVDVSGLTKGKGFAGCVKRHGFKTQDATHGNSLSHRAPGSTGQCQDPGRVFKGKKMPGRMGASRRSVQNLEIISINEELNYLCIKGGIPGAKGKLVSILPAVKKRHCSNKEEA